MRIEWRRDGIIREKEESYVSAMWTKVEPEVGRYVRNTRMARNLSRG